MKICIEVLQLASPLNLKSAQVYILEKTASLPVADNRSLEKACNINTVKNLVCSQDPVSMSCRCLLVSRCCSCCLWSSSCRRTFILLVSSNCSDWRNSAFCLLARLHSAGVLGSDVFGTYKHCATKQQFALPADSAVKLLTERFRLQNAGSLDFSCSEGALLLLALCVWILDYTVTAWTIADKSVGKLPDDDFKDCCLAFAHVKSLDRQPNVITCWNITSDESAMMLLKCCILR